MSRLGTAIRRSHYVEAELARTFAGVAERHADEPDVFHLCTMLGEQSKEHAARLLPFAQRYRGLEAGASATVAQPTPVETGPGSRLLADLSHLFVLAQECWIDGTVVRQAALAKRDKELVSTISACLEETSTQVRWLQTRIKTTAPQALTIE
jgi:hypothetical protein